jgi:hypothetical protein
LKLAKLYDRLQRYSELAVALRESATTGFAIEQNMLRIEPGQTGCSAARKEADKALQDDAKPRGAGTTSSARFSSSISNPRNQIEHGGIQDEVLTAGSLKNQLSRCIKRLEDMIEQIAAAAGSC